MTTLSTRAAFKPNSGHFGASLCPAARRLEYDRDNDQWRCKLGGTGNPVLITSTLQEMEEVIDQLDNMPTPIHREARSCTACHRVLKRSDGAT